MKKHSLNLNWNFWKEEKEKEKLKINVPHDAMLLEERIPNMENGSASGFYPGGKYIYTKSIFGEQSYQNATVIVEFEGIYMNSTIYLNGEKVGGWIYGYTNFYVDLTKKLIIGEENELKVIVDNSLTPNSRWYSGSGIYRPVNLYVAGKEYIKPDGIRITTKSIHPAVIQVEVDTVKEINTQVAVEIYKEGIMVASGIGSDIELSIPDAKLWTDQNPERYFASILLKKENTIVDQEIVPFGIRVLDWSAKCGLLINETTVKLKGGCVHHDNGPLGAATNDKAEYRKLKKMKSLGYNAVRYSHNPAGKNFLNICDEIGIYVIDETFDQWKIPQSAHDYAIHFESEWEKDLEALIKKDYNHPSVIMYCVGNEITDTGHPHGGKICRMICNKVKQLDSTRPTTIAINSMLSVLADKQAKRAAANAENPQEGEKNVGSKDVNDIVTLLPQIMASITPETLENLIHEVTEAVDIVGYNYGENLFEGTHVIAPNRVILSSETFPARIGKNWPMVHNTNYVIGDFMWTAWDYLGEAGIGLPFYGSDQAPFSKAYPCLTAGCGSIDLTGYVESQGKYTAVVFGEEKNPCIAVRPLDHAGEAYTVGKWRLTDAVDSWTWPGQEGKVADIEVYSIGKEVEIIQNGVSIGREALQDYRVFFKTEYQPGTLLAISYDENGMEIGRSQLVSADDSECITILAEENEIKADREDLAYINIQITDENGIVKLLKDRKISVTVEGAGKLVAMASGNPETTEKFTASTYTSYHGRLLAIVQSNGKSGEIKITAHADGVSDSQIIISAK